MLAILAMIFFIFVPDADHDGDGYGSRREVAAGCSPLRADSFPTCQWGEVVACSTTEPGYTPAPEPC